MDGERFGILLVDDEPFVREGLKGLIDWAACGFEICGEAANGRDALGLIRALTPSLVITDIRMPEMDGMELVRAAAGSGLAECRFIVLSGYDDFQYAKTAIQYNVKRYILKPVEEEELIEALVEIRSELEGGRERALSLKALAAVTMSKLTRGDVGADESGFAGRRLHARDGVPMAFIMAETVGARIAGEDAQAEHAALRRLVADAVGGGNLMNCLEEEPGRFALLVTPALLTGRHGDETAFCRALHEAAAAQGQAAAVYAGRRVQTLRDLKDSYESCRNARERNFYDRESGVFPYDGAQERAFGLGVSYRVENYVRAHYASDLSLKDIAERFYVNPVYLGQLFRKHFGVYFNDYLHGLRIEEATRLLTQSDLKVHEVAGRVGYADADYFIRKFKKHMGASPSQFRNK